MQNLKRLTHLPCCPKSYAVYAWGGNSNSLGYKGKENVVQTTPQQIVWEGMTG